MRDGQYRAHYQNYWKWLQNADKEAIARKRQEAELLFHRVGITFNVYGDDGGAERLIPFDSVPRIIPAREWMMLDRGIRQRVQALNAFLHDIYHQQHILKAGIIPAEQVMVNDQYQPCMQGIDLHRDIYAHIVGVDMVRNSDGDYYVLEDNLRTPSGVSYMLENRKMMMRLYPELFAEQHIAPVERYPSHLLQTLRESSPVNDPVVVVLTPGRFNSAYFEHSFLAQQMGVELVESADLFVKDGAVMMRTTAGPCKVDVIYRRVDDAFLDPLAFRPESMLGVPGLLSVYRAGNVVLANAIGTGVADDKSIYPYVPDMIRFYLDEEPILNNVPTWQCRKPKDLSYVLANLQHMVVKEVHGAGVRHVNRSRRQPTGTERLSDPAAGATRQLHRAKHPRTFDMSNFYRKRPGAAPYRSAPVCLMRRGDPPGARRFDAGCAYRRLAGGELITGRRH